MLPRTGARHKYVGLPYHVIMLKTNIFFYSSLSFAGGGGVGHLSKTNVKKYYFLSFFRVATPSKGHFKATRVSSRTMPKICQEISGDQFSFKNPPKGGAFFASRAIFCGDKLSRVYLYRGYTG